jgi:diguanylate cyclase (GGDEF)-like protein
MRCSRDGRKVIVDDRTSGGLNVQLLIWRVAVNPVTTRKAVVVTLLQVENSPEEKIMLTYNYIARALSQDYSYLYLVDLDTEQYTEYTPDGVNRDISEERRGDCFFEETRSKARSTVYRADQKEFLQAFTKENIEKNLLENNSFTIIYRNMEKGVPVYVSMKITKIRNKGNCVIIGVNNIDAQMKEKEALELEREEKRVFSRMAALSGDFIAIYTVDPETNDYYSYIAGEYQEVFGENIYSNDFFRRTYEEAKALVYDEDKAYFYNRFRKEYIISEIRDRGMFIMHQYRILIDRKPVYVKLKATIVHEEEADRIIMGIINIDAEVRREKEYAETIQLIETEALTDELTGVKRKHAYMDLEKKINAEIIGGDQPAFAVGVFDINGLKEINDTLGHQAGDRYILEGCRIVCKTFQHSPVYRMGGDEFAVIAQGSDYEKMEQLMSTLAKKNVKNLKMGGVVVAAGMVKYTDETCVAEVFAKADAMMYQNKKMLKRKK